MPSGFIVSHKMKFNINIMGTGYTQKIFYHFHKGDNFSDFLFAFLFMNLLLRKGIFSKRKEFVPLGAKSSLLE